MQFGIRLETGRIVVPRRGILCIGLVNFRFKAYCWLGIILECFRHFPLVNKASAGIIVFYRRICARNTNWRRALGSFVRGSYCDGNMRIIRILLPQYLSRFTWCALRRILPCFCTSDFTNVVRGNNFVFGMFGLLSYLARVFAAFLGQQHGYGVASSGFDV